MAKKQTRVETTTIADEDDDEQKSPREELDEDTLRALVEIDGADEIRWQIHRKSQPNPGYCGELSTTELSLYRIAGDYGAGRYKVKGIKADGSYFKSATITIAETPKRESNTDALAEALKKGGGDSSLVPLMLAMMSNTTQITVAAMNQRPAPPPPPKEFPWGLIVPTIPATLLALKEFFANKGDDAAMEKILKMITVVDKLKGADDKATSWPDVVRDALGAAASMFPNRVPQPSGPRSIEVTQHNPVPESLPSNADTPAQAPSEEAMLLEFIRRRLDTLVEAASRDRDPQLQAELFMESLDELPQLLRDSVLQAIVSRPDWFEQIAAMDARVAPYRGWMARLRDELMSLINEGDSNERATESE